MSDICPPAPHVPPATVATPGGMIADMMRWAVPLVCWVSVGLAVARAEGASGASDSPGAFELKDGDRVAFIGNTFVEREQSYSYLETLLRARWPERKITFRNLGWSGDTVYGHARGYFDGPEQGFARLNAIVHELKPTVIFISY